MEQAPRLENEKGINNSHLIDRLGEGAVQAVATPSPEEKRVDIIPKEAHTGCEQPATPEDPFEGAYIEQVAAAAEQEFFDLSKKITIATASDIPQLQHSALRLRRALLKYDKDLSEENQSRVMGYNENGEEIYRDEMFVNDIPEMTPEHAKLEQIVADLGHIIRQLEAKNLLSLQTRYNVEEVRTPSVETFR